MLSEAELDRGADPAAVDRGAVVSADGGYRYLLWRTVKSWAATQRVAFVMLNPSTADALVDDPTIRKCRGFAERWGFGRVDVVNLFAYRATKPKTLETAWTNGQDITGPENGRWLAYAIGSAHLVVFAWGASVPKVGRIDNRVRTLLDLAGPTTNAVSSAPSRSTQVKCLGYTKDGQPRHPLMLPYTTPLVAFGGARG